MRWAAVWLLCACGRLEFNEQPRPDTQLAATITAATQLECSTHVLLDGGGHNPHDILRWMFDGEADWLVGADHYAQDDHKIEGHPIAAVEGVVTAGDAVQIAQANHVDVLNIVPVPGGHMLGYWDFNLGTAYTVAIAPGLAAGTPQALGPLYGGNSPLARVGSAMLTFAGTAGGAILLAEVGDDAVPTGRQLQVISPADGPGPPSVTTVDDGLIVAWRSGATGGCKLAKVGTDLSIVAGPVDFAVPGCNDPHVAWLESFRRVIAVAEGSGGLIVAATWNADLAPLDAPHTIGTGASWPRIAGDRDAAWVTWAEGTPKQIRNVLLDATALVQATSPLFGALDESLGHYHQIDRSGSETVITWMDSTQGRTFSARRLCR